MYEYVFQVFKSEPDKSDWMSAEMFDECPDFLPIADSVKETADRREAIVCLGRWLTENRLGTISGDVFTINTQAAERYFEGRFAAFQQALTALQTLHETQFIHEHDKVQTLIDDLGTAFSGKQDTHVLLENSFPAIPMDEFIRKAQPNTPYYIGAVLYFHW